MKTIAIAVVFGLAVAVDAAPTIASAASNPIVPGDLCDYGTKQLTCSQDLTIVYSCNQTTNIWEFLWKCEYPAHCFENGSFCAIDWPPPPIEQWGNEHGH